MAIAVITGLALLALPATALAGSAYKYPAGTLHVQPNIVQITFYGPTRLDSRYPAMSIDGVKQKAMVNTGTSWGHWAPTETYANGVWTVKWTWVADPALQNQMGVYCYPASTLSNGPHLVAASIKDVNGATLSDSWTFTIGSSPVIGTPTPAAGSTVATLTPTISVPVSDNGTIGVTSATVNGVAAATHLSAGVLGVTSPVLPNDATTTVFVSVADVTGSVATATWSFWVETSPDMTSTIGSCTECHHDDANHSGMVPGLGWSDCVRCHVTYPHPGTPASLHKKANITACTPCHVSDITVEHARHGLACVTCHQSTVPAVVSAISAGDSTCSTCHVGIEHTTIHQTTYNGTCTGLGCHNANLATEHVTNQSLTCMTCHGSSDSTVVSAISGGDMHCTTCHGPVDHTALHATTLNGACTGAGCHDANIATEHIANHSLTCQTCHASSNPVVTGAISAGDNRCTTCHGPIDHTPLHLTTNNPTCTGLGCHNANLATEHVTNQSLTCQTCHASSNSTVSGAISSGDTRCTTCHGPIDHTPLHATTVNGSCTGTGCHNANIATEHITNQSLTCATCHASSNSTVTGAISSGDPRCTTCHGAVDHTSLHDTTVVPACTGTACHAGTNLVTIHASLPCSTCHASGDSSVLAAIAGHNKSCTACHSASAPHPNEASAHAATLGSGDIEMGLDNADHGVPWTVGESCTLCHYVDLRTQHRNQCQLCHVNANAPAQFTGDWNKTCSQGGCHPEYHTQVTSDHYGMYWDGSDSCDLCHNTNGDFSDAASNCTRCHDPSYTSGAVGDTQPPVTTSDAQTGYQGGATVHLTATDVGTAGVSKTFYNIDGFGWVTGNTAFVAAPSGGSVSHTLQFYSTDHAFNAESVKSVTFTCYTVDTTPPSTTSSFNPATGSAYNSARSVTLTPTDNAGGSGVKATYYRVDSGSFVAGTSFSVSGEGLHTFSYYSVDNANNTETTHVSNQFRIDTVPPVTSSNITSGATYVGAQTFTLSASDTGSGVSATFWQLDSTSGPWHTGTSVSVAAPSSGTAVHTLYFYSWDNALNGEIVKSVPFTMSAVPGDHTPPTTSSSFNPAAGAIFNSARAVTLTPTDNVGGSGVKATYYRIDSGSFVAGTSFSISGDGLHTFSYYSVDNANNTETTHVSNQFRIDTILPSTSVDIVGGTTYIGAQTFTLSASDTGSGVSATYWQLDSTSGSWTSGTSVPVSAPASGITAHTLYYYSVDNATNAETVKSVSFNMSAPISGGGAVFIDLYNDMMGEDWADSGGYDFTYQIKNSSNAVVESGSAHSGDLITAVPAGGPYTVSMSFDSVNEGTINFTWTGVTIVNGGTRNLTGTFRDWWDD